MLLVLDLGGVNDVDLNSARNEIVYNEKWDDFEQKLAYLICKGLFESVEKEYWEKLVSLLTQEAKSDSFTFGLRKLIDEIKKNTKR